MDRGPIVSLMAEVNKSLIAKEQFEQICITASLNHKDKTCPRDNYIPDSELVTFLRG